MTKSLFPLVLKIIAVALEIQDMFYGTSSIVFLDFVYPNKQYESIFCKHIMSIVTECDRLGAIYLDF